jgi:ADP-ribosylglycohydrolase
MRILPIGLANIGNKGKVKEEIFSISIITHGHSRAIIRAILYGYVIDYIINFRPQNFIALIEKNFYSNFLSIFLIIKNSKTGKLSGTVNIA